jgi:hypothetical protein
MGIAATHCRLASESGESMNRRTRFGLAALAALVVQLVFGGLWHQVFFHDLYLDQMAKVARPEPLLPAMLLAVAVRAVLFAAIYPVGYKGGALWREGARFGVLMGLLSGATAGIFYGTTNVGSAWLAADVIYFAAEGALAGIAVAYCYGKQLQK